MGLNLSVGHLAELADHDAAGAARVRADFEVLYKFLRSKSLPPHREPEEVRPLSCEMWGYSGLHYLRRAAAHLAAAKTLPPPGDKNASNDSILLARYAARPGKRSLIGRWFGGWTRTPDFEHVIQHSDAEGYYLPQDFAEVLVAGADRWKIPGEYIGSSVRLLDECERLARALELPLDLDPESEEVWLAPDSQGEGDMKWKRYGVESLSCLRLHAAAKYSLATGAAIVFC
jgi:hypothetical protein